MLNAAERCYRFLLERRRRRFTSQPATRIEGCKIVSVGNLTTGGTGKTPTVQYIARHLQNRNKRVAIVSRGYGGSLSGAGAIVSNGKQTLLNARQAGDEPLLHARSLRQIPVLIGRDRVAAARRAVREFNSEIVVLDDGFQFWSLARDVDLVLLDALRPFDNGHLLPRGHLRESPDALCRADAILFTRTDSASKARRDATRELAARYTEAPIFWSRHAPVSLRDERSHDAGEIPLEKLNGARVHALSALANNPGFRSTLEKCGAHVEAHTTRRDHHRWRRDELIRVLEKAKAAGAIVVTTEKDAVKLAREWYEKNGVASNAVASNAVALWSLCIELQLLPDESSPDESAFADFLDAALEL